jgi:hypothetical protein
MKRTRQNGRVRSLIDGTKVVAGFLTQQQLKNGLI